jgi:hypothetical protein
MPMPPPVSMLVGPNPFLFVTTIVGVSGCVPTVPIIAHTSFSALAGRDPFLFVVSIVGVSVSVPTRFRVPMPTPPPVSSLSGGAFCAFFVSVPVGTGSPFPYFWLLGAHTIF